MSYEKQTWAKGDIVTSAKLNHMEDGIGGGSVEFVKIFSNTAQIAAGVNFGGTGGTLVDGKTFGELIGDRKVINIVTEGLKLTGSVSGTVMLSVKMQGNGGKDFILNQNDEAIRNTTSVSVNMMAYATQNETRQGTLDIYAVCI